MQLFITLLQVYVLTDWLRLAVGSAILFNLDKI